MISFKAFYHREDGHIDHLETSFWEDLSQDDLLFVDVIVGQYRHRLLGADFYWFKDNRYGMIYDGSCCEAKKVSFTIDEEYKITRDNQYNEPESVHLLIGKMLPDDEWYRLEEEFSKWL